ncbi:MAG: hypothetical protein KAI67_05115 [Candidatus Pacebacteria bacterium]|nr:hypothetical protein [Candidatus Paceibacterota bacterium]
MICIISQDVFFWTLSTIIQSMVAFVALLGMVAVYKMQITQRNKESIAESMRIHLCLYIDNRIEIEKKGEKGEKSTKIINSSEAYSYSIIKIEEKARELSNEYPEDMILKSAVFEFSNIKKGQKDIRNKINDFFLLTISLISFSLILLPMSSYLECNKYNLLTLVVIVLWSIGSLYLGYKLVKKLI